MNPFKSFIGFLGNCDDDAPTPGARKLGSTCSRCQSSSNEGVQIGIGDANFLEKLVIFGEEFPELLCIGETLSC